MKPKLLLLYLPTEKAIDIFNLLTLKQDKKKAVLKSKKRLKITELPQKILCINDVRHGSTFSKYIFIYFHTLNIFLYSLLFGILAIIL